MSYNVRQTPGSGILRSVSTAAATTKSDVRHDDVFCFGYGCKLYRDDEKARDIDQGKHLIPWMGDNNLKIDRYDVRGALYDLTTYESIPGGYGNRLDYLSADEQRAEQLCEEERYLFLYNNEDDVIMRQEEELKRLKQETNGGYNQVGMSYDEAQPIGPCREEFSNSPACEEPEQAFQLPYNFEVPPEIELPETMKQHAIIEKTARFIATQGMQMEILLKAKQSNNAQFEFLSQNSTLKPYYKHVINAIKNGTYPDEVETKDSDKGETNDAVGISSGTFGSGQAKSVVLVPTIKYKPSADCAYTQLISKIKGVPLSELHDETSRHSGSQQDSANNSPSITPVLLQYNGATFMTEPDDSSNCIKSSTVTKTTNLDDSGPKVEILKKSSALALAQNYSSDSESEQEEHEGAETSTFEKEKTPPNLEFPLPVENLKNIIDKTAVYVIKNGRQFEETLRSKSAERFTFLLPDNEFYAYYLYKITGDPCSASKERKQRKAKEVAEALMSKKGLTRDKTSNNPVSFSIKMKDEVTTSALQQTVLPQDASDDEEKTSSNVSSSTTTSNTTQQVNRHVPEHVQKAIELVESQLMARNAQIAAALALRQPNILPVKTSHPVASLSSHSAPTSVTLGCSNSSASVTAPTKAEAERNAIFEQQQQQRHKELKKAEEKVKDKLAQIAREKLGGLVSKEKQLQLERKRKAMAFLNQIKAVSSGENDRIVETNAVETVMENKEDVASGDSDNSVQSIPITSYGPEDNSDEETELGIKNHNLPVHVELVNAITKITNSDDDDEVCIVSSTNQSELNERKRTHSNHKDVAHTMAATNKRQYRKHDSCTPSRSSGSSTDLYEMNDGKEVRKYRTKSRSKSKSCKSKKTKSKKLKSKKKSKKRAKSKTRSCSPPRHHGATNRYRQSGSYSHSDYSDDDSSDNHSYQRKRSSQTSSGRSHKSKRHRYE